jgi:hypothetical protein
VRREHHHLVERSRDKGLIAEPSNIITVAAEVHALITAGMIVVEGTNADTVLRFHWRADVPKEQRIVVIKSRRKSQREAE